MIPHSLAEVTHDDAGGCAGRVQLTIASHGDRGRPRWTAGSPMPLRFHSVQFPRWARRGSGLHCSMQEYALPADVGDVYRVLEVGLVQAGEAHPLPMVTPLSPRMFGGGRYCAVMTADIAGATGGDTSGEFAILAAEPVATGDVLQVTVACSLRIPTVGSDADVVLVPAGHLEALIAFVEFRVHWALETDEAINLGNVSILLSQLGTEARHGVAAVQRDRRAVGGGGADA